jgi:hypothetical protein
VSWQHPSNLPASSGLETQHRPPSFLLSPDGPTTRASYMPRALEGNQNNSQLGTDLVVLRRIAVLRVVLPRPSAHVSQIGATRGHPIHPWSFLPELHSPPLKLLPSRSFWYLAWAIPTCHAHASRHSLQRTKHNHHLATLLYRSLRVHQCTLFPCFFLLPSSPPLSSPRSNNASSRRRLHTWVGLRSPN